MLKEKIIDKTLRAGDSIETERSRCLRMRFNRNECGRCLEQCDAGAIGIYEDVKINTDKCTECMLCVSACPSGCFEIIGLDFYSLTGRLRKVQTSVQSPVLGCLSDVKKTAHEKTFCLGFLSEEHIIALYVFLHDPMQIDLSGCTDCRNSFIAGTLESRVAAIEEKTSLPVSEKIMLIRNKAEIDFHAVSYDRRGFFSALKNATFLKASVLFENNSEPVLSYSAKKLPFKRELLNRAAKLLPEEAQRALFENYYYDAKITGDCNNCFACIGMCPSGALKIEENDSGRELFFSSSLCSGCGLCENFCITRAVGIKKGFPGKNPFEFISLK
jgi:ferredoxin